MKRRKKKLHWEERAKLIDANHAALLKAYSEHIIRIPQHSMWDFAIPEMYWNMSDGFLWSKAENYRGIPVIALPGKILYLHHEVGVHRLGENEFEKLLCFDRHNNKYTVVIEKSPSGEEQGNPSYFRFLPRVQPYISKADRLRKRKEQQP